MPLVNTCLFCWRCDNFFLGDASPRQVRTYMPMPVVACSHMHRHRCPYFLGDTSPRQVGQYTPMLVLHAATCIGIDFHTYRGNVSSGTVVISMLMLVVAQSHMHQHRLCSYFCSGDVSLFLGDASPRQVGKSMPRPAAA